MIVPVVTQLKTNITKLSSAAGDIDSSEYSGKMIVNTQTPYQNMFECSDCIMHSYYNNLTTNNVLLDLLSPGLSPRESKYILNIVCETFIKLVFEGF